MPTITRFAPAKINLTLEVLGKRADGYHEIRSLVTTVDLFDVLTVEDGQGMVVTASEGYDDASMPLRPWERNTVETALGLMANERRMRQGLACLPLERAIREGNDSCRVRLHKRVPAAAGLGGGSSDGAAAIRVLDSFWSLGLSEVRLTSVAARIGSDCPFFLRGGVQLLRGRGDELIWVEPHAPAWFCLAHPPVLKPRKTARLYALLRSEHWTGGERTDALTLKLSGSAGQSLHPGDLGNVFDAVADEAFGSQADLRRRLRALGANAVHLCGSGPTLYGLFDGETTARAAAVALCQEGHAAWVVRAPASAV